MTEETIFSAALERRTPTERVGSQIGPYKLLQQIGEGGMGTVWMAEQAHPVRRKVALKLIKSGMDTRQVIARFEAERQALALMDHANIARVLDAGATDSGRPCFVMDLVKGVPITRYCDEHLRQLAIAAHHFHDNHGKFPAGGRLPVYVRDRPTGGTNLMIELLPYFEQDNLYKRWDYNDNRNNVAGEGQLPSRPRSSKYCSALRIRCRKPWTLLQLGASDPRFRRGRKVPNRAWPR